MPNTAWNPADKTDVTLSGGNLTAIVGSLGGVRAVAAYSAGKYYYECTWTLNTNSISTGLALSTASLSSPTTGWARITRANGHIIVNAADTGASISSGGAVPQGSVIGLAVDLTAQLIWFRLGAAGNWNGSGTANPATAAGGISISALSGALYPAMFGSTNDKVVANFGDSAFSGTVPSGFTAGWPAASPSVDFVGNLGGVSSYGKLAYGVGKYSRIAAFAPAFAADITVSAGVTFSGDLAPAVSFNSDLGVVWGLGGDLAPAVSFAGDLSVAKLVNFAGDLQPQIDFNGDLSVDIALTALAGSFGFTIGFAGSDFTAGPLWAADQPCPSAWTASETCPPSLWTPDDCDPVAWEDSETCNG